MYRTSPVFSSIRPTERSLRPHAFENQIFPLKSAWASCTPCLPFNADGVPSDQSLPLFVGYFVSNPLPGSRGTSYSVKTTRAASPLGRGRRLNFMADGPGPRTLARYSARSFLKYSIVGAAAEAC